MRIDILTLFPEIALALSERITQRARAAELVEIHAHNLRDWSTARVDDLRPAGHGNALARLSPLSEEMRARLPGLVEVGAVESQGRGKGIRYFLSRELFAEMGLPGAYTRQKGLDHETNKALLVKHLESRPNDGSPIPELGQVLPALSRKAIGRLLDELRHEGRVSLKGEKRGSRWLSSKAPNGDKTELPRP